MKSMKLTPFTLTRLGKNSTTLALETTQGISNLSITEIERIQLTLRIFQMSMEKVMSTHEFPESFHK